eukprot:184061_1
MCVCEIVGICLFIGLFVYHFIDLRARKPEILKKMIQNIFDFVRLILILHLYSVIIVNILINTINSHTITLFIFIAPTHNNSYNSTASQNYTDYKDYDQPILWWGDLTALDCLFHLFFEE